jgi:hypothetical protein
MIPNSVFACFEGKRPEPLDSVCSHGACRFQKTREETNTRAGRTPTDFMKRSRNRPKKPLQETLNESSGRPRDSIFGHTAAHGVTQKPTSPINQGVRHN